SIEPLGATGGAVRSTEASAMSPPESTADLLYTNAERASMNEQWDSPPVRCSLLDVIRTPLKLRRKHRECAGDHSPGITEPAVGRDYLDYEHDVSVVRVEKPTCEVCHQHGHHPPHPRDRLEDMLRCRICGASFHLVCLRQAGLPRAPQGALLTTHLWSCMKCETLDLLLSDSELRAALDAAGGVPAAGGVTWSGFVEIHDRMYQGPRDEDGNLPAPVLALLREEFARFDRDHLGSVSWTQLLTRFVLKILRERHSDLELVSVLKPLEVRPLKEEFAMFDTLNGGAISVADARRAVLEWRDRMGLTTSVEFIVDRLRSLSDHPDEGRIVDVDRFVTWENFMCALALPVIAARPNTWGGPDYLAFLEDGHASLLGPLRFRLEPDEETQPQSPTPPSSQHTSSSTAPAESVE
ncbi:unnamed protein product, partial [Ixodes hexagonus]